MPFMQPTFGGNSGSRVGVTDVTGTLNPIIGDASGTTSLAANIGAYPPFGTIGTIVTAGFSAGVTPPGKSMLVVIVAGAATTARTFTQALGGYAAADAEVSITIEEWSGLRPVGSAPRLLRIFTSNSTRVLHDWAGVLGYQLDIQDGLPVSCAFAMPIRPLREYRCLINLVQSATCQGISGEAVAVCNMRYNFPPVFFDFT
jgi:hypothetical protein